MSSPSSRHVVTVTVAVAFGFALALAPALGRGDDLASTVDAAIQKLGSGTHVSGLARVVGGDTLWARDEHEARTPASTMKLVTTAAALDKLGATYEHETRVLARGAVEGGTVKGDLWVLGAGDPTISRRFDGDPLLGDWAAELAKKVKVVEGDVVADDRAFERLALHPDWDEHDTEEWYGAEISALSLNDNCVDVETTADAGVKVKAFPGTSFVTLDVRAKLGAEQKLAYVRERDDPARAGITVRVDGKVKARAAPFVSSVPVRRPALFFATVLRERLVAQGVVVKGGARLAKDDERAPSGDALYAKKTPIARSVGICNKRSQNFYAECLLKSLGRAACGEGTWAGGARAAERYLDGLGVAETERKVRDGSGLSREGRLSAAALVKVLESAAVGAKGEVLRRSLSVAGEDGTLEKRLKGLPAGVAVRGKTGTMHGVSALAGLVELETSRQGAPETIAFALIVNGTKGAAQARAAQDELVHAIIRARASARTK